MSETHMLEFLIEDLFELFPAIFGTSLFENLLNFVLLVASTDILEGFFDHVSDIRRVIANQSIHNCH